MSTGLGASGQDVAPDALVAELTRFRNWEELAGRWSKVVDAVVAGYQFSIYDYRNDLDVRSIVEDVVAAAAGRGLNVPTGAALKLSDADARFMASTRPASSQVATRNLGPWADRVPSAPGDELARDLAVERL